MVLKLVAVAFTAGSFVAIQVLVNSSTATQLGKVAIGLDSANVHLERIDHALNMSATQFVTVDRLQGLLAEAALVHQALAHEDSLLDVRLDRVESLSVERSRNRGRY